VIKCADGCATVWPPLTVTATPTAGSGVGQLTTIVRPDGTTQVASSGWPLYRFAADKAPGDTMGDGVAGIWHVATVGAAGAAGTATTQKSGSGGY
jgi:predicted lipoprotein with Yx(FWY)xxD motif